VLQGYFLVSPALVSLLWGWQTPRARGLSGVRNGVGTSIVVRRHRPWNWIRRSLWWGIAGSRTLELGKTELLSMMMMTMTMMTKMTATIIIAIILISSTLWPEVFVTLPMVLAFQETSKPPHWSLECAFLSFFFPSFSRRKLGSWQQF
jgi:hypothetical protein